MVDLVRGRLLGSMQLASGRLAMTDDGLGFSLVSWQSVLELEIGREVRGLMRGGDISWRLACLPPTLTRLSRISWPSSRREGLAVALNFVAVPPRS